MDIASEGRYGSPCLRLCLGSAPQRTVPTTEGDDDSALFWAVACTAKEGRKRKQDEKALEEVFNDPKRRRHVEKEVSSAVSSHQCPVTPGVVDVIAGL